MKNPARLAAVFLTAAALFTALALFSCADKSGEKSAASANGDNSLKAVMDKKVLVLGLDDSFPPMGFRDEQGEIVGYDIDLAREVTRRMGITLRPQPIDWNAKEQELSTGEIDCIWNGFTINPARKEAMTFTPAYLKNAQVIVVKSGSPFKSKEDFQDKKIGVQAGSSAMQAIDDAGDFKAGLKEVVEYKDNLTALMDLEVGGVDGVVMDLLVANDNINRSKKNFIILEDALAPEEYGIGFRKGDEALAAMVWTTLEAMADDGTIAKIATKWFGADISIIGK